MLNYNDTDDFSGLEFIAPSGRTESMLARLDQNSLHQRDRSHLCFLAINVIFAPSEPTYRYGSLRTIPARFRMVSTLLALLWKFGCRIDNVYIW